MSKDAISIRPFIGARNFEESKRFYNDLGFVESYSSPEMSYFNLGSLGFYLQDAYVKDWVDNSMLFLEVADLDHWWTEIKTLVNKNRYPAVRLKPIVHNDWGSEFFLHDPSGILWHIGVFH